MERTVPDTQHPHLPDSIRIERKHLLPCVNTLTKKRDDEMLWCDDLMEKIDQEIRETMWNSLPTLDNFIQPLVDLWELTKMFVRAKKLSKGIGKMQIAIGTDIWKTAAGIGNIDEEEIRERYRVFRKQFEDLQDELTLFLPRKSHRRRKIE